MRKGTRIHKIETIKVMRLLFEYYKPMLFYKNPYICEEVSMLASKSFLSDERITTLLHYLPLFRYDHDWKKKTLQNKV